MRAISSKFGNAHRAAGSPLAAIAGARLAACHRRGRCCPIRWIRVHRGGYGDLAHRRIETSLSGTSSLRCAALIRWPVATADLNGTHFKIYGAACARSWTRPRHAGRPHEAGPDRRLRERRVCAADAAAGSRRKRMAAPDYFAATPIELWRWRAQETRGAAGFIAFRRDGAWPESALKSTRCAGWTAARRRCPRLCKYVLQNRMLLGPLAGAVSGAASCSPSCAISCGWPPISSA